MAPAEEEFIELLRVVYLLKLINYMNKKKNIWILSANYQEKTPKYRHQVKRTMPAFFV